MNDTTKKIGLIVIVILAVAAAIFMGKEAMMGPTEIKKEIGHGTPGHGMKAAEKAEEAAAAANAAGNAGAEKGGGGLAGPDPTATK